MCFAFYNWFFYLGIIVCSIDVMLVVCFLHAFLECQGGALLFLGKVILPGNPLRGTLLFLLHAKLCTHREIRCGCIFPQCCWGYHLTLTRLRIDIYIISSQLNKSWVSCFRLSQKTAPLSGVGVVVCCKAASFPSLSTTN